MDLNRQVQGIKRIFEGMDVEDTKPGKVIAQLPRGYKVRITGSNRTVDAEALRGSGVQVNDNVVLFRLRGQRRWMIWGAVDASSTSTVGNAATSGVLAPPENFTVRSGWGYIIASWDVPPARPDLTFHIEIADDIEGEEQNVESRLLSTNVYLSTQTPGVAKKARVRSINTAYEKSGWTDWQSASANTIAVLTGLEAAMPDALALSEGSPFFTFDTHVLWIVHNGAWEKVAGGEDGGTIPVEPSGPGYWDVDLQPETPHANDNEFESSFSEWTEFDTDNRLTPSIGSGQLSLYQDVGQSEAFPGLWRSVPDSPWTITAKMRVAPFDSDLAEPYNFAIGVAIRTSAAADDDSLTRIVALRQTSSTPNVANREVQLCHFQGLNLSGWSDSFSNTNTVIQTDDWLYVRLRNAGLVGGTRNMYFDVSLDGFVWETLYVNWSAAPTHVGLIMWNLGVEPSETANGFVEFFRYSDQQVPAGDPVYGNWVSTAVSTKANVISDVSSFDRNTLSPKSLGTLYPGEHVHSCAVLVDEAFDGTLTLSVGDAVNQARLFASTMVDPSEVGHYISFPEYTYTSPTEIFLYLSSIGNTTGAGRLVMHRKESYG